MEDDETLELCSCLSSHNSCVLSAGIWCVSPGGGRGVCVTEPSTLTAPQSVSEMRWQQMMLKQLLCLRADSLVLLLSDSKAPLEA